MHQQRFDDEKLGDDGLASAGGGREDEAGREVRVGIGIHAREQVRLPRVELINTKRAI